ncbi:TldD/PmbA family protein, partial [bacterium]|nr:TldD/PmbA family protein [bacterium]
MMQSSHTRREFLKIAGGGLLTITASPLIIDLLFKRPNLCLAEELSEFPSENQGVPKYVIDKALNLALSRGADFADVYIERTVKRVIEMKENSIKKINYTVDMGAGIRVLYGESTGFAFCEDLSEDSIYKTAKLSASLGKSEKLFFQKPLKKTSLTTNLISQKIPLPSITEDKRIFVMKQAEEAARYFDSKISEVFIEYNDEFKQITIANSDGTFVDDIQPTIYLKVNVLAVSNGSRQMGRSRVSGKCGFELFDKNPSGKVGRDAAEEAIKMLKAKNSPSGEMPVVVTSGWGGVLFHEAVGHGLEGDGVSKGSSYFAGRIGERVASDIVTFVDDATIPNLRGSFNYDDEGTPSQRKILIDKGILKGFMTDILSAKKLKTTSTGNGRRESLIRPHGEDDKHLYPGGEIKTRRNNFLDKKRTFCKEFRR